MNHKIEKLIDYTLKNGGVTFNKNLEILENLRGYTISIQKYEYKTTIDNIKEIEENILQKIDIIGNKKNVVIGLWLDDNILYIDINMIELNFTRAMAAGKEQNQLAIFDNVNKKSIYLKGKIYILYEYLEKIDDIIYIKEFTSKKDVCKFAGFAKFFKMQKYIYKEFAKIDNYFIRNNKKYILIEE